MSTYTYDANGNVTVMPQMTLEYNVDNRLVWATHQTNGVDEYGYDPAGQRITKGSLIILYGVDGKRVGEYAIGNVGTDLSNYVWSAYFPNPDRPVQNMWFAGRPLEPVDAVGSRSTGGRFTPYGVEVTPTANDAEKFATYYRDQKTGLDYAMQRYYQSGFGRFMTPDPYIASGGVKEPQSWNRYAYVVGDPVRLNDPTGLQYYADYYLGEQGGGGGYYVNGIPVGADRFASLSSLGALPPASGGGGGPSNPPACGFGYGTVCGVSVQVVSVGGPPPNNEPEPRIPTRLMVRSDCYWPNGTGYSASYTRVVTYQVLDQDWKPFNGSEVPTIYEHVHEPSGPVLNRDQDARWVRSINTIDAHGVFVDSLASSGAEKTHAIQSFTAGGAALGVIGFGPSTSLLNNVYSNDMVTINGTISPRECVHGRDPELR